MADVIIIAVVAVLLSVAALSIVRSFRTSSCPGCAKKGSCAASAARGAKNCCSALSEDALERMDRAVAESLGGE